MKCPYQKRIIHKPEYTENYILHYAVDIEEFADCCKNECPFYRSRRTTNYSTEEHCKRAEGEA